MNWAKRSWAIGGGALLVPLLVIAGLQVDCVGVRTHVKPPVPEIRAAQTQAWLEKVHALGSAGDWLAIRGYHATDDLVVTATNSPISHVAVLDTETDEIFASIG